MEKNGAEWECIAEIKGDEGRSGDCAMKGRDEKDVSIGSG